MSVAKGLRSGSVGIGGSGSTNSPDQVRSTLAIVSSVLTTANCTLVAYDCQFWNREPCSSISQTCGACLSGYVGQSGPGNTQCIIVNSGSTRRRRLSSSYEDNNLIKSMVENSLAISSNYSKSCNSNTDCQTDSFSSTFAYCSRRLKICVIQSQECSQSCSNNGRCLYVDTRTGADRSTCVAYDTTCVAQCECNDGYYGPSCSEDYTTWQSLQDITSLSISALQNLTSNDDANIGTISSWTTLLSTLTSSTSLMKSSNAIDVQMIADRILSYYESFSWTGNAQSITSLQQLLQGVDNIASITTFIELSDNSSTSVSDDANQVNIVNNTLFHREGLLLIGQRVGRLISAFSVANQPTTNWLFSSIRLSVTSFSLTSWQPTVNLTVPQTTLEEVGQELQLPAVSWSTPSSIRLSRNSIISNSNEGTDSDAVELSALLLQLPIAVYGNHRVLYSEPIYLQLSYLVDSTSTSLEQRIRLAEDLESVEWNIQHANPVDAYGSEYVSDNLTTICHGKQDENKVEMYRCPDSGALLSHYCNASLAPNISLGLPLLEDLLESPYSGQYISYCPQPIPSCASFANMLSAPSDQDIALEAFESSSLCTVTDYNVSMTTCRCILAQDLAANLTAEIRQEKRVNGDDDYYYYYGDDDSNSLQQETSLVSNSFQLQNRKPTNSPTKYPIEDRPAAFYLGTKNDVETSIINNYESFKLADTFILLINFTSAPSGWGIYTLTAGLSLCFIWLTTLGMRIWQYTKDPTIFAERKKKNQKKWSYNSSRLFSLKRRKSLSGSWKIGIASNDDTLTKENIQKKLSNQGELSWEAFIHDYLNSLDRLLLPSFHKMDNEHLHDMNRPSTVPTASYGGGTSRVPTNNSNNHLPKSYLHRLFGSFYTLLSTKHRYLRLIELYSKIHEEFITQKFSPVQERYFYQKMYSIQQMWDFTFHIFGIVTFILVLVATLLLCLHLQYYYIYNPTTELLERISQICPK